MPQLTLGTVLLLFSKSLGNVTLPNRSFCFGLSHLLLFITKLKSSSILFLDLKHKVRFLTSEKKENDTDEIFMNTT